MESFFALLQKDVVDQAVSPHRGTAPSDRTPPVRSNLQGAAGYPRRVTRADPGLRSRDDLDTQRGRHRTRRWFRPPTLPSLWEVRVLTEVPLRRLAIAVVGGAVATCLIAVSVLIVVVGDDRVTVLEVAAGGLNSPRTVSAGTAPEGATPSGSTAPSPPMNGEAPADAPTQGSTLDGVQAVPDRPGGPRQQWAASPRKAAKAATAERKAKPEVGAERLGKAKAAFKVKGRQRYRARSVLPRDRRWRDR